MKKMACILLLLPALASAQQQRIAWGGVAELVIPIGVEQVIATDPTADLDVGVPTDIQDQLDVLVAAGRIFLTAKSALSQEKIVLRGTHGAMLISLSAVPDTASLDYVLTLPVDAPGALAAQKESDCVDSAVALSRWALQTLYAPARLIPSARCFTRVPHRRDAIDLFRCGNTRLCGGSSTTIPIASWRTRDAFVHALEVRNHSLERVMLDARDIAIAVRAASFAHTWLDTAGSTQDTTVLVLVADDKLEVVVPVWRWLEME